MVRELAATGSVVALAVLVPLALKWRLPLGLVAGWAVLSGAALGALAALAFGAGPSLGWLAAHVIAVLATSAAVGAAAFFHDPERHPPSDPDVLVSPADGEVLYVREFAGGEMPPIVKRGRPLDVPELAEDVPRQVVGIGMHLLNVHVNRAPLAATVRSVTHSPGRFLSLRDPDALAVNERMTTVFESGTTTVAVVQIASRLVRRIVSYVEPGSVVEAGQRIGMIKFGSQVDLVLPDDGTVVCVRPGEKVRAGQTVIARSQERVAQGEADGPVARSADGRA